jgi:homospermidine synthase
MKRITTNPHEYRRAVEDRVSKMPLADDRWHLTTEQKLESLAVCSAFGTGMAWAIFNPLAGFITGLTMTAVCLTVWVQMRRQA